MRKLLLWLIRPTIKDLIEKTIKQRLEEMIKEANTIPKIKELKKLSVTQDMKTNFWYVTEHFEVNFFDLVIYYREKDIPEPILFRKTCNTCAELVKFLEEFIPIHPYLREYKISVTYKHEYGEGTERLYLVSGFRSDIYSSKEIKNINAPIIKWFKDRPELII